jgi:outer membrane protein TolC
VFARDVVSAANARYASGTAPQSDVLRAEVEVARLEALACARVGEVRGAEAVLNTSRVYERDPENATDLKAFYFASPLIPTVLLLTLAWCALHITLGGKPLGGRTERGAI